MNDETEPAEKPGTPADAADSDTGPAETPADSETGLAERLRAAGTPEAVTALILEMLPDGPDDAVEAPEVFLESIRVAGFRGIGPEATLSLRPRPGLTLVIGRNGSGKSSFAEAAELTLTADSMRWAQRPVVFREGWRNLHHDGDTEISVRMRLGDDSPPVTIRRSWERTATDPADALVTTTVGTARRPAGEVPAWLGRMSLYRPFLSARDLERVITAKPSELYDALAPILGLAPLAAADAALQARRREREERVRAVRAGFAELRELLAGVDDDRARQALKALGGRFASADLDLLETLAGGDGPDAEAPAAAAAHRLIENELPDVESSLRELVAASDAVERLSGSASAAAERTADLLRRALDLHTAEGDRSCPVCRCGHLDEQWRVAAETETARLEASAAEARAARAALATAQKNTDQTLDFVRRELRAVASALEVVLPEPAGRLRDVLAVPAAGVAAGTGDTAAVAGGAGDMTAVVGAWRDIASAYIEMVEAATRWLVRRRDVWREPGAAVRRWRDAALVVRAEAAELSLLVAARAALGRAIDEIRAERLAAFVGRSESIWRRLRQESNVELHRMRMEGTATQRKVRFPVAVDGAEANALAVMSQGELHALGLSVFLPRATAEASPYRFVIVDDPVQSMDPAKVDGLAEVLGEIAATRQVVVFTHDDRLPEAVRRLGLEATVWEAGRRERSVVELRKAADPASRYLADAYALAAAQTLPEDARFPVVAGFCRSALEAAGMDHYRARRYRDGATHREVESRLAEADTVKQRLTLAFLGDLGRGGELYTYLNRTYGGWAADTVRAVAEGAHGARRMPMRSLVANTSDLVEKLQ
ncbi:AAA family ATPase [Actinoplanes sp. NPDC049802]|uniref:AAA family ATPase n=1 Tax=Actinoplanes sp. NPDC049802 TaxID=3154742 RepID=UPI003409C761